MTCICAITSKGNVYMGGDSAGVSGLSICVRSDEKVFHNGNFLIGFTSSFRAGQLLRYKFSPPKQADNIDDMKYMVTDFIDSVRNCFFDNGYGSKDKNEGATFLVGYNKNIYQIDRDFQVGKVYNNIMAVGCGEDLALGSLYTSSKTKMKPEDRILLALETAEKFSAGVVSPFTILKQ